ncbi:cell division protein FtsB [Porticoccus sp. W117]|uniref:cell division protein FtsB n=1 Tax=Porticoccus sp. W117 TaxID=3054777 RepID=UPI0025982220|nr:cell division protein FtsB [Porticoccus sp. W117]MDM3870287.1 cell division protein FtsB [Porticoccus sp. W117]
MRWLIAILIVFLIALQYRLWFGEGSVAQKVELEKAVAEQQAINQQAEARNQAIGEEVKALKNGMDAIEERARSDLGMIKEGETFYIVVEKDQDKKDDDK